MDRTFQIPDGTLTFTPQTIRIADGAKRKQRIRLLNAALWILFAVLSVLRYRNTLDPFLLWSGVAIGAGHLAILVYSLSQSSDSEIPWANVASIKIKHRLGQPYLAIKHGRLTRPVHLSSSNSASLDAYLQDHVKAPQQW
ncbi:hypothetical protein [Pontibacter sp. G13]|uniref:hypothetical protein n=1 Tax=Pontibacter sp. G13 TaxID=3074898 RepID=UPI00288B73CF|nr:hypothetical protein [Pontibacter sp. G13]WNJ17093.1 hypothetical protein RJD25_19740 [Pontibacter sp. G13]